MCVCVSWHQCVYLTPSHLSLCVSCSGAISSRYTPVGQRPVRGRQAQRGGSEGPPGEGGPAGGGDGSTDHQRRSRHPAPGEVHAGGGGPHHR